MTSIEENNSSENRNEELITEKEKHKKSAEEEQQELSQLFGYKSSILWDRYRENNKEELIKKLDIILPTADEEADGTRPITDAGRSQRKATSDREKIKILKANLVEAIWSQRKYGGGSLLMSPIFVLCVPESEKYKNEPAAAKKSVNYTMHPVFRIFKCSNNNDSRNCCMIFVDETARVYQNWYDLIENNQYPPSIIVAPVSGIYNTDDNNKVLLETFSASCLSLSSQVAKVADVGSTVGSLLASGVVAASAFAALPVIAVTAAVGTGIGCAAYFTGRGIQKLVDRGQHEQTIGLAEKEPRNIWLGIGGGVIGLAAGAATKGVEIAARSGQNINTLVRGTVNTLSASAIVVNGVAIGDGCVNLILANRDGDEISYFELAGLGASLFLFTHSVRNFQTAEKIYSSTQQKTLLEFKTNLSKNQQRIFAKMMKETIRINGPEAGTRDVIRSLRNIPDQKGFFRDLYKINKSLNENNVKISFDGTGNAMLNHKVPVAPSELRADLRQLPAEHVFANVPGKPETNMAAANLRSYNTTSTVLCSTYSNQILHSLSSHSALDCLSLVSREQVLMLLWRFYIDNKDLIEAKCKINFDDRFVDDIIRIIKFLADKVYQTVADYLQSMAASGMYNKILEIYKNRYLTMILANGDMTASHLVRYEEIVDGLQHIRNSIVNEGSFMETVIDMLESFTHVVVDKLVRITKMSFCALMDSGIRQYVPFEDHFDDVLKVISTLTDQLNLNISDYVFLIDQRDIDEIHLNVTAFYDIMRSRKEIYKKCSTCHGRYAVFQ